MTVESVRARITRARVLIDEATKLTDEWCAGLEPQFDHSYDDNGDHIWKLADPGPAPDDFGIRLGEIAHNLHSCLDHIVYAIAVRRGKHGLRTQFPLVDNPSKWRQISAKDLVGVSPDIIERIRAWQPFNVPDDELAWGKFLGELSNYDKHRTVTHTSGLVSAHDTTVQIPVGEGQTRRLYSDINADDSGAVSSDLPWAMRVRVEHDDDSGAVDVGVIPFVSAATATFDVQFAFKQNTKWRFGIGILPSVADWVERVLDDLAEFM